MRSPPTLPPPQNLECAPKEVFFLQESMSKGDMNPVMYGILKMVESYKVQTITYSQKFHNFYTYLLRQLCEMPKFCL